jgi:hypothetical protein
MAQRMPVVTVENGVTMVANPGTHIADSLGLIINSPASVRIGVLNGPREYMIGKLAGMHRRSDGSTLLADATTHEVRVFDDSGRFVRLAGGAGTGPGEYNWLTGVFPHSADSVVIMDHEGSRATIVDTTLSFVRRYRVVLKETRAVYPMTSHRLIGFFDDGTSLVSDYLNVCGAHRMEGFCEDSVAFFRVTEDGTLLSRFGRFVYSRSESRRGAVNISIREPHPQAFWTVQGARFYYADAARFEVRVFLANGTLERVISVAGAVPRYDRSVVFPPTTPPASADAKIQAAIQASAQLRSEIELPREFPAFSDLLVDAVGRIWLREYYPPGRKDGGPHWFVFEPDGRLNYRVRLPSSTMRSRRTYTTLHPQIGADFILAAERDADGVESVALYRFSVRGR